MAGPSGIRVRRRIVISGRVQGVGFRYATLDEARRRGLSGWVRNTRDGNVEIVAEGHPADVQALIAWCHLGPAGAHVVDVQVADVEMDQALGQFQITR